jgi:hypothetical protein
MAGYVSSKRIQQVLGRAAEETLDLRQRAGERCRGPHPGQWGKRGQVSQRRQV